MSPIVSIGTASPSTPRELGRVYTPPAIARGMVRACLDRWFESRGSFADQSQPSPCRILDPACGDGAFLLQVFDELCQRDDELAGPIGDGDRGDGAAGRLAIVRDHIFGVDIDPPAVDALRAQLLERIAATGSLATEAAAIVQTDIRCGDSLTGSGLSMPRQGEFDWAHNRCQEPVPAAVEDKDPDPLLAAAINWKQDFPAVADAGGFDIIVGNPPYLRERNAKALFDALAATELGRRWREARMDMWYYFVHRSLDLLRPGGLLSFIVNSYWMSSRGAGKLIERLERETQLEEIELLNDSPVFKAVAGRHMIFRLRKRDASPGDQRSAPRNGSPACRIRVTPRPSSRRQILTVSRADDSQIQDYEIPLGELFQNGRIVVAPPDPGQCVFRGRTALGVHYNTRQGMAENPPAINRRLQRQFFDRYVLGEGVFVLSRDEVERLNLPPPERSLLRPYYETTSVGRYWLATAPSHQVLYLTRHTAPRLDHLLNIAAHLERFRPILERRRETRAGTCAWWQLHWPREEAIFLEPRILSVQMGNRPQFVFAETPTFIGFSINLVLPRAPGAFSLEALTGILNSNVARSWFERHAKRRGVNLEINAHVLRQFPLPGREPRTEQRTAELVRARQGVSGDSIESAEIEREIEELVGRLYGRESGDAASCAQCE